MEYRYDVFETGLGWVGVVASERGLQRLVLPRPTEREVLDVLGVAVRDAARSPGYLAGLAGRLRAYFDGYRADFTEELNLPCGTEFQRRVWDATRRIGYGETRSYHWVAEGSGNPKAVRAVGQALGANPLPIIIPCHRVVASDGGLGGYGGGLELKRRLLGMECGQALRNSL